MRLLGPKFNFITEKTVLNPKKSTQIMRENKKIFLKYDNISTKMNNSNYSTEIEEKYVNMKENVFFEGPPCKSELLIPFVSILTVIGIIPFVSSLFRQLWVRYKITNRRISVSSGFQGNNKVEIVYRDIKKISYITRLGGMSADLVILLKDNARLEIRSLPQWEKNLEFIKNNCPEYVMWE